MKDADKYSHQLIVVLTSGGSSIIGENVDMVIDEVKEDLKANIRIKFEGFEEPK